MVKYILCIILALTLFPVEAISSGMDYAQMSNEQLIEIDDKLTEEMLVRGLYAYISMSGKKFHSISNCSGMETTMRVSVTELELCGYEPCKRCYKGENK